jgi:hypothetical protein
MSHELAKRGKSKLQRDFTLKHVYKAYESEHGNDEFRVDEKTFRDVIIYFNKRAMQMILEDARELILPYRLGSLRIVKCKMHIVNNKLKVDFNTSRKLGKTIYHLNDHTDGYYYKFHWRKIGCNAKNYKAYCLQPVREYKRKISQLIKNKQVDYFLQ